MRKSVEEPKEVYEQRLPGAQFALVHEVNYEHAE
jgi:hypothetical protein